MIGLLALTFLIGSIVGAVVNDLARGHQQRSATQNLLRAMDSGTIYYGHAGRASGERSEPSGIK
jgi:hypothetical protein